MNDLGERPPAGGFGAGPGNANFGPIDRGGVPPSATLALAAMVCGIVSIPGILICFSALPLGLAAIAMGIAARRRAMRHPHLYGGDRYALAGIVCGAVGLVVSVGLGAVYAAMFYALR